MQQNIIKEERNSRVDLLRDEISDYMLVKESILTGIQDKERIATNKKNILKKLNATNKDWDSWQWQMANRVVSADKITEFLNLSEIERRNIKKVAAKYRFAISPYYLSLINMKNLNCPIKKQSIPSVLELNDKGKLDPMDEKGTSVGEIITRRYPDRLIIKITNCCGMFCRHCQRRRLIGEEDTNVNIEKIKKAIKYIKDNEEIRDVLITGGDALMFSDEKLEWLVSKLRNIKHVEIIRLGTRTPVTLPQRITPKLMDMLKKYHPIYLNTHFNSPMEVTEESKKACELIANAGIPIGNQMVLLKGINDDPFIVRRLNQALLAIRVKPYYIFHPKNVKGTSHFWVKVEKGIEIMESLRGRTSGLAIPAYIVNGPNGLGKTPILPNYLLSFGEDKVIFRNWEGKKFEVPN